MAESIICPKCSFEIEVSAALAAQLREQIRKEFEADARQNDREIVRREQQLHLREQELEVSRQSVEAEVLKRLATERTQLSEEARSKAHDAVAAEIGELHEQIKAAREKLGTAQKTELELRKDRRELEDEKTEQTSMS